MTDKPVSGVDLASGKDFTAETTTVTFKMADGMDVTMPVACNSCRFPKSDTILPELDHESVQPDMVIEKGRIPQN